MIVGNVAKAFLKRRGYDLHRASRACTTFKDAFADQDTLLKTKRPNVIFDIGANTGQTAAKYRAIFPKATIFGFEPFAECLKDLRRNFEDDEAFHPVHAAVSNEPGAKAFHVNESSFTNSLLRSVDPSLVQPLKTIEVPVTTIDRFCVDHDLTAVEILKLDIQGGELLALQGASRMLTQNAISLIYTEVLFAPQYEQQALFFELYAFLSEFGFVLFDFYDLKHKSNGQMAWCDVIFLGPQLAESINAAPFYETQVDARS